MIIIVAISTIWPNYPVRLMKLQQSDVDFCYQIVEIATIWLEYITFCVFFVVILCGFLCGIFNSPIGEFFLPKNDFSWPLFLFDQIVRHIVDIVGLNGWWYCNKASYDIATISTISTIWNAGPAVILCRHIVEQYQQYDDNNLHNMTIKYDEA